MTFRPARLAHLTAAAIMAVALLPAMVAPVGAAGSVTLEARALVGGRFQTNGWLAFAVTLANDGPPLTGYLAADGEDGTVRRLVELPAGARKVEPLYLRPAAFVRTVAIRFESVQGASLATARADVRVLEQTSGHVAIVGDGGGNLRPQIVGRGAGFPEPILLAPADLPERPEPLRGIATIVWATASSSMTEPQRRSLERWVAAGGQLIVLGGPDWQARIAAFGALLPVEGLSALDGVSIAPLAAWTGAASPGVAGTLTAAVGATRAGAISMVNAESGGALLAAISRGAGRVAFIGVDLATEPFRSWAGAPLLWTRLLPDNRIADQWGGVGQGDQDLANAMTQSLSNLPSLALPPAELLLAVLVGYILLIGPLSYLVMRRLDRRELAWVVAPILVVVFSGLSYGIGISMKGSQIIVNEIAVVRSSTDGTAASVSTYAGISSPTRSSYDLTVRSDALLSALTANIDPVTGAQQASYATEQGDPAHLRGLVVSVGAQQSVRAEAVIPYTPSLRVTWSVTSSGLEGHATNESTKPMEDVAVISTTGGVMIGTLAPGASKSFRMPLSNFTGGSASQQVYGGVPVDTNSATGRRVVMRSQVIDGLVGSTGFSPGKGVGISGGVERGPFVIGWQSDATPVEVDLDGQEFLRYAQMVEVLSGQPQLGPGSVTIGTSQMTPEVVSTAGEATAVQPGVVTVGNGEAVFRISLPLEATGLATSAVTIVTASDASTVLYDQANVGAFLPSGFRAAVYDVAAADWVDLGDLSQRSRFDVTDPARVVDASGRILVRITGSGVRADFGQQSVFVGARVSGVIAQ